MLNAASISSAIPPSETVAWTAPAPRGLIFRGYDIFYVPFSLLWTGFVSTVFVSVIVNLHSVQATPVEIIPCFMFVVGLYLVFGRFIFDMIVRARTTYVVTDRAAYIVQPWFAGGTKRFGAATAGDATFISRPRGFGTIRFLAVSPFSRSGNGQLIPSSTAFERIADAAHVYDLVTSLNAAASP